MNLNVIMDNYKNSDYMILKNYLDNYKMLSKLDLLYCAAKGLYLDYDEDGSIEFKEYKHGYANNKEYEAKVEEQLYRMQNKVLNSNITSFGELFNIIYDNIYGLQMVEELDCYNIALILGSTMNIYPIEQIYS
ncbi:hypothetical protein GOM49_05970 [Clostridium bovifaecis]|uniref:Uncharacterized protein n=1 Tax=Clostridium bovifaecis TaxID=2184719 RepID=A0A6I6FAE7_9CLOT|nr:hypothetical protein GOM49_05970 [Clostridium bovifaecis]